MHQRADEAEQFVVVSGAAGGIGANIVQSLCAEGTRVVAMDIDEAALEALSEQTGASSIHVNVADTNSVTRAVEQVVQQFGVPDGLVCAAGINSRVNFLDVTVEEWERIMGVNLTGTFLLGQGFAREMVKAHKPASIVNIASIAARVIRRQDVSAYAVSKAGVEALTKAMAASLAEYNIRVNAVAPGPIKTEMTSARRQTEEGRRELMRGVLRGRLGGPKDVSSVVSFLLSEQSDFMTGNTIVVDGGVLVGCANYIAEEANEQDY